MKIDTSSPEARRQYDANADFASRYVARLAPLVGGGARPRVLVTGFGRFEDIAHNATGRIVSALVGVPYPATAPPRDGEIDPPEPQIATGVATMVVPGVGAIDLCAIVLPVHWDLAAILVAREIEALRPSFVLMNGVAGPRQALWLELGATNRAARQLDGSRRLRPHGPPDAPLVPILDGEVALPSLLSWRAVETAAKEALARHTCLTEVLPGVLRAGFPRASNTYLCNNLAFVTGWLMRHPGRAITLLEDAAGGVEVRIDADLRHVPRAFVHWPSGLGAAHDDAAADVMRALVAAQVAASAHGDAPTPGDDRDASEALRGGDVY